MTIYINGKFLCQQATGTQIYAMSMLNAMTLKGVKFVLLSPKKAKMPTKCHGLPIGFFNRLNLWEQLSLPWFLLGKRNYLLLNFCNSAPLLVSGQIVTVHDLAFEYKEQAWFGFAFRNWYRFLIPRLVKRAKKVWTVSNYSKNEIVNRYQLPESKIQVLPNVWPQFNGLGSKEISEKYILLVGAENPRKNAAFAIGQLERIQALGYKLVLVSAASDNFYSAQTNFDEKITVFGYLPENRYYSLLKHASALLYLSSYEGFGIPILESISLEVPVICLELPVYKEIFGELPVYMKSLTAECFETAISNLSKHNMHSTAIERLRNNYSLENAGQIILNTLKELQ